MDPSRPLPRGKSVAEVQGEISFEVPLPTVEDIFPSSQEKRRKTQSQPPRKKSRSSRNMESESESDNADGHYSVKDIFDEWFEEEETPILTEDPKEGDWILVKFSTKKTVKYYVECMQKLVRGLEVCIARYFGGQKFKWLEVEDLSLIDYDQIECRLDNPVLMGRKHNFQFAVDFQVYNIN
mgnify:CR=1 FL=1